MKTNYVLIDFENVQVASLALLSDEHFSLKIFLGPTNMRLHRDLVMSIHQMGARASYVVLDTPGRNALDFHIAFHLGVLAGDDPSAFYHIISRDTGFDPLIKHLYANRILAARSESIEAMPCFATRVTTPTAEMATADDPSALDAQVDIALADLIRRKAAKPRSEKSLINTIRKALDKEHPKADVSAVCGALATRGHLKIEEGKVSYSLPASA